MNTNDRMFRSSQGTLIEILPISEFYTIQQPCERMGLENLLYIIFQKPTHLLI